MTTAGTGGSGETESELDELLGLLLADEGIEMAAAGIARRDPAQPARLSYAQERMWILDQLEGDDSSLGLHGSVALIGDVDLDALEHSLLEIFRRHDVLRTVIVMDGDEPRPQVLPAEQMSVTRLDVDGDEHRLGQLLQSDAHRSFDMAVDPPVAVTLIRVTDDRHVLSIVMHHVASDGSSFAVFSHELDALYGAFTNGQPSPLPPLEVQYEDYAAWQRDGASAAYERQLAYWREQLADPLPTFEIPTDFARPPRHTFDGATVNAHLDDEVAAKVDELADRSGATTFMALLAAFEVVASRHAGDTDVVVGTPIAGRVRLELEPMIGAFLNTLVLRTDLTGRPTFRSFLDQVRTTCVGAYANQDVPFELVLADLAPPRDLSRTPLFQVFFNMLQVDGVFASDSPSGLRTELLEPPDVSANFDLTMYVNETLDGIELRLVYNRGLYDTAHMERFMAQYQSLLAQIVEDPDRCIDDYALGDDVADADMLPDPSASLDDTWHGSVPDSIREIAERAPERVCVIDDSTTLDYGDVAARMERLSTWLRQSDVGSGDVVAIRAERCASVVWTVAGALASGASYVIIDARYPPSRVAELVGISKPSCWIDLAASATQTPADERIHDEVHTVLDELGVEHRLTIAPGEDLDQIESLLGVSAVHVDRSKPVTIGPDDPACLTFTSGSTGQPKAVVGRHGSLTHFLPWMTEEFGVGPDDRFSMLSGLSHDPIQRDMFWPLSIGAAIVVPDPEQIGSPGYIADWIREEAVSVVHLTPAMGQLLTEHADLRSDADRIESLRVAQFIGDVLTRGEVADLRALAPNVKVVNLYGTTETQRASGFHVVDPDAPLPEGRRLKEVLPLGRGMPGAQLLVRRTTDAVAAIGEVGEIVMRSPHLALGYHEDDELTSRRFEVDRHGVGQLYATGDRGRFRSDGSVEFLGRDDDQVQLRGFRVELGEVAAAIRREPGIADAVVDLRTHPSGSPALVSFVVADDDADVAALGPALRAALPAHMIPSAVTRIDRVPLTPNGKIDRRSLPDPFADGATESERVPPRDDTDRMLVGIWERVLGRHDIGIDDDFFALGGYSLLATRVLASIEDETGKRLAVATLFEHPTVRDLADVIQEGTWRSAIPPVTPAMDDEPVTSYTQERMWFLDQFEDERAGLKVGAVLDVRGHLDVDALRASLDEIYRRHDVLRTLLKSEEGNPRPLTLPAGPMPFEFFDVDGDMDAAERHAERMAAHEFDLAEAPPVVAGVVRISDEHHHLSVLMHHAASDASSLGVFFAELQAGYLARVDGTTYEPEPLEVQYADYASWQRLQASEIFDEQLDYWRGQLHGTLPVFEIPSDFQRPEQHSVTGARIVGELSAELSARLAEFATAHNATMFMALLTGFEIVLSRHADQTDVVIGTPVAGRVRPELDPMIGAFLNTLVLRTDLGGDPTVRTTLERVRDTSIGAFDHQDVPFELLLNELQVPRDRSRSPLFQIFFNMMHHEVAADLAMPGIDVEILEQSDRGSKFDLTMYANHGADGTHLALVYNRTLFDHGRMQRFLDQYINVLSEMVADPDRRIAELSLVTAPDRTIVPDATADLDATWHGSVPGAVRRVAASDGSRIAVVDGDESWDYARLDSQMSGVAGWLSTRGVGAGDVVAILAQRSGSLLPAVTGALASGAAYVLLDPRYPAQRLALQLEIARPRAWIALEAAGDVPDELVRSLDDHGIEHRLTIPVGADDACFAATLGERSPGEADAVTAAIDAIGPDHAACLTFTSGSTGTPKAVLGRHGSLTHFLPWMSDAFDIGPDDRFSMLSGLSHDPLQRDMFWPLWLGARIVVPDPERIGTAGWVASWMRDESVTVAHLTPAMGKLIAERGSSTDAVDPQVPSLRRALFIGEALTLDDVDRLQERAPSVGVVNLYGTTETQRASGFTVVAEIDDPPPGAQHRQVLPLGRGMPGAQLLVRNACGDSTAVGEVGEIAMRSPHLALGYLDDAELTARRFAADPHDDSGRVQIYATGDRGRYRIDGSVEFLGRQDDQVELRGFRIELGDIASTLVRHDAVGDAVAQLWQDGDGEPQIVAYVRPVDDESVDSFETSDVLRSLRSSLPAHMVPSTIIAIDRIPLTPNGKLDRRALPAPTLVDATTSSDDGPADSLERMLIDVWEKVLGRKNIGIHDDFFALGGYSLLATRLFAIVHERTGQQLPVSVLFEHPTIAHLASAIRDDGWTPDWSSLVPIQPAGTRQPFFYVSAFLMSVLELAPLGAELGGDQPLYGLQPRGLDGEATPHSSIEEMATHYIDEMKSVQPEGPYAVGGHCAGSWVAFEMVRQLEAAGEEVNALILVDQGPPGLQRTSVKSLSYLWGRVRFYFAGGRLRHALAWSFKITTDRFLLSRAGSQTSRDEGIVKDAHRMAHRAYEGGQVRQDLSLILSADSMSLTDKAWYTLWSEVTDASLTTYEVGGTHALLLVEPHVRELAATLQVILGTDPDARTALGLTP